VHAFTPHQPRPSLQKSQAKKFTFPAMRTIKDFIWYLLRKNAAMIPAREVADLRAILLTQYDMLDIANALMNSGTLAFFWLPFLVRYFFLVSYVILRMKKELRKSKKE
jgi:hypothetical protein